VHRGGSIPTRCTASWARAKSGELFLRTTHRRMSTHRSLSVRGVVGLLVANFVVGSSALAQRSLPSAIAHIQSPFSRVASVVPLGADAFVVSDPIENSIVLVAGGSLAARVIGRQGRGPGEYTSVAGLVALNRDSVAFKDPISLRIFVINAEGEISDLPIGRDNSISLNRDQLVGADRVGGLYFVRTARGGDGRVRLSDSSLVVRVRRDDGSMTVVSRLRPAIAVEGGAGPVVEAATRSASPRSAAQFVLELPFEDGVLAAPDGGIVIVRASPYRVDRCRMGASCSIGPVLRPAVPFSTERRKVFAAAASASGEGRANVTFEQLTGWPSWEPAFSRRAGSPFGPAPVWLDSRGFVVVERIRTDRVDQVRHDVIDSSGRRTGLLVMAANQRIVGFVRDWVVVATRDENDLERLSIHSWPAWPG